jgi:threonine dehydrogenase-like Zn-dependent dehydrogenase
VRDVVRRAEVRVDLRILVDVIPRFLPSERSTPVVPAKSLALSESLKAPRRRSENSQTGICGGVRCIIMNIGAMELRIVGSLAMSRRARFTALRAMYSAWTLSRSAIALASSALVSS